MVEVLLDVALEDVIQEEELVTVERIILTAQDLDQEVTSNDLRNV